MDLLSTFSHPAGTLPATRRARVAIASRRGHRLKAGSAWNIGAPWTCSNTRVLLTVEPVGPSNDHQSCVLYGNHHTATCSYLGLPCWWCWWPLRLVCGALFVLVDCLLIRGTSLRGNLGAEADDEANVVQFGLASIDLTH